MTYRILKGILFLTFASHSPSLLADESSCIQVEVRDMHLETSLIADGRAAAIIIIPTGDDWFAAQAARIVTAAKEHGVELPVETDENWRDVKTLDQNLILLGNRDSNQAIKKLYYLHYTLLDARYPGVGGSVLRSLHNPFGDGHNVIFAGGSDHAGVSRAVDDLVAELANTSNQDESLHLGYLQTIRLGEGMQPPVDAKDAKLWEQSNGYANKGYFGWNLISRNLALFYMTGKVSYAKEFLRLAFPDESAVKELVTFDKEAYDDPSDPLAKPYHYQAIMMILYWDLVEEHPFFSEADRMRITKKFAEQFHYDQVSDQATPATVLPDRHILWQALCQYSLARYFAKQSPNADVDIALRNVTNIFEPFKQGVTMLSGTFIWYNTYFAPAFFYAALSDPLEYAANPSVNEYSKVLLRLSDRVPGNWSVHYASPFFLNLAAALTEDQALVDMISETKLDMSEFRVGQSYQPVKPYPNNTYIEDAGQVIVERFDAEAMKYQPDFPANEVSEFVSYRQQGDNLGDYLLLDTKYETGRNPFHNFALISLRLNGDSLLRDYGNQIQIYCDGQYSSDISLYTQITAASRIGSTIFVRGELANQNRHHWQRTILLRENRFLLVLDEVTALEDTTLAEIRQEWQNTNSTKARMLSSGEFQISPKQPTGSTQHYTLASSQSTETRSVPVPSSLLSSNTASRFSLVKPMLKGEKIVFATILRPGAPDPTKPSAAQSRKEDEETFAFRLPHPALLTRRANGGFLLAEESHIFAFQVSKIDELLTADAPLNVDYDVKEQRLSLSGTPGTSVTLWLEEGRKRVLTLEDEEPIQVNNLSFAKWQTATEKLESRAASILADKDKQPIDQADQTSTPAPPLAELWKLQGTHYINSVQRYIYNGTPCLAVADGKFVRIIAADGSEKHVIEVSHTIGALYWWGKYQLLLVGTRDEKLRAFDTLGNERWTHTAKMASELIDSQKFYWFKKSFPGVIALKSLALLDGREVIFVGGAGTVEIIDEKGQLEKRFWQTWGPVDGFTALVKEDAEPRMFCCRSMGGRPTVFEISPTKDGGWYQRDMGHTMLLDMAGLNLGSFGFSMVGRNFLSVEELVPGSEPVLVGDFNGAHNRIMIWNLKGQPIHEVNPGPGFTSQAINSDYYGRATERDLNVRGVVVLDLDGNGSLEIAVAMDGGYVLAFDHELQSRFVVKLKSAPALLTAIERPGQATLLAVADMEGEIRLLNATGETVNKVTIKGKPTVLYHAGNQLVVGTSRAEITSFTLPNK